MNDAPILEVRDLQVSYKTRKREINAVRDVTFDIRSSENLGLVGESGCGKSTVAFSIVGFLGRNGRVTDGSILFKGQALQGRSEKELRQLRGADISMVYQNPMSALNPTMHIGKQLVETLVAHRGLSREEAEHESIEALNRVYMPDAEGVMRRYSHQISGGQQQRVLIAMAMINNPELLIMDEPTTALDVTVEAVVLDLIAELKEKYRTATLYISHNLGVVARVSDKVGVMYAGEIVELAPTETIFSQPLHPYTLGLMRCLPDVDAPKGTRQLVPIDGRVPSPDQIPPGCIFAPRCQYAIPECSNNHPRLTEIVGGHNVRCIRAVEWLDSPPPPLGSIITAPACQAASDAPVVLSAQNVKTYYPVPFKTLKSLIGLEKRRYVKAVDNVSVSVSRGRTLGIVGESGCGKSSLARTILGLEPLHGGQIDFVGVDIAKPVNKRTLDIIRELQMVFQNPDSTLNPSYSIGEQIAASLRQFQVVPKDQVHDEVVRLLEAVRLSEAYYNRLPRQLSGGEKQRVGIARAFASSPNMVVCDEPVSALDVSVQAAVLNLLLEIQRQHETTMILISHDLSAVRFFSDDVAVMYLGRIVEIGPCESIYQPPNHPYTAALLAAVPRPDPNLEQEQVRLSGVVPSAVDPPSGCRFNTRCPFKIGDICEREEPPALEFENGHKIYCHLPAEKLYDVQVFCRE